MTVEELSACIKEAQKNHNYKTVTELYPKLKIELERLAAQRAHKKPKKCEIKNGVIIWPKK